MEVNVWANTDGRIGLNVVHVAGKKRMQEMMTVASDAGEQFSSALAQMLSKVNVESSRYLGLLGWQNGA